MKIFVASELLKTVAKNVFKVDIEPNNFALLESCGKHVLVNLHNQFIIRPISKDEIN